MRLTVGGEPTFVLVDDMDGDEWNSAADGPAKRRLAADLIGRLRDRFAPGGLLHFGQGKWYPGKSLPRWAYALYWRRDGKPLWRDASLVAIDGANRPAIIDDAERFATTLADNLGIDPDYALPTYEDPLPYIAREQSLPENVDPFNSKLEDPEERARLARVFERGLGNPVGWTLPIQRWNARDGGARWISGGGQPGAAGCSWCRETRRSVSGCRSAPCLGCRPKHTPTTPPRIHSRSGQRCRILRFGKGGASPPSPAGRTGGSASSSSSCRPR